jgi:hypothetical protein
MLSVDYAERDGFLVGKSARQAAARAAGVALRRARAEQDVMR